MYKQTHAVIPAQRDPLSSSINSVASSAISDSYVSVNMSHPVFTNDSAAHRPYISDLRDAVGSKISGALSDGDCVRFLRARAGSIDKASEMVLKWYEWRHTLMDPLPLHNIPLSPLTLLATPSYLDAHPHGNLFPVAHQGFSKEGYPIYWEQTGRVQSYFPTVLQHFTVDELVQYHVLSNNIFSSRYKYASEKFGKDIQKCIVVNDMSHVSISLDMESIRYIRQILDIDQNYFPERLHKLIIINCPWYFPALYAIFKPFIDARTSEKFMILGKDFLPSVLEHIDADQIPVEYGGTMQVSWDMNWDESTGASKEQLDDYIVEL